MRRLLLAAAVLATPAYAQDARLANQITYLHDRLHITPSQQPLWSAFQHVWLDNSAAISAARRDRFQTAQRGNAVDILHADEALDQANLDALKKYTDAFTTLYAALSEPQRQIANVMFRQLRLD